MRFAPSHFAPPGTAAVSGKRAHRPPVCRRERLVAFFSGLLIVQAPWYLAGFTALPQFINLGIALTAFAFLFLPVFDARSPSAKESLVRLLKFPVFWLGGAFLAYLLIQYFNPYCAYENGTLYGKTYWWLASRDYADWLPSGIESPYASMNPLRYAVIWAAPFLLSCALWAGAFRRKTWCVLLWAAGLNALAVGLVGCLMAADKTLKILWIFEPFRINFFGPFTYRNQAGIYLYLNLGLFLGMFLAMRRKNLETGVRSGRFLLCLLPAGLLVFCISVCGSRGALLAMGAVLAGAVLVWLIDFFVHRDGAGAFFRSLFLSAAFLALIGGAAYAFFMGISPLSYQRFLTEKTSTIQDNERYQFQEIAKEMVCDRPVWGWGAGGFRYISQSYLKKHRLFTNPKNPAFLKRYLNHAHCDWLELPAELGAAGCLPLAGILLFYLGCLVRYARDMGALGWMIFAALAVAGAHGAFEFMVDNPAVLLLLAFLPLAAVKWAKARRRARFAP